MGTPLGETRTFTPSVKLRSIGDYVDLALVDVSEVPWLEFGTQNPKIGKDGKPRNQERVIGLVIGGTGVITDDQKDVPVTPDNVVAIYLGGHRRWEWIEAKKKLDGGLQVGDVMRWRYDRDEASTTAANNPKKVHTVQLRHPKPEEAARTARCEELHSGASSSTPLDSPSDDEPF